MNARLTYLPLLLLSFWLTGGSNVHAAAHTSDRVILSSTSHGVTLSVTVPWKRYAPNSLIKVIVRIKNDTQHSIQIPGFPESCGSGNPVITITDSSGAQLYPPGIPLLVPPPCMAPTGPTLTRGHVVTATQYAIARGPTLQGVLQFEAGNNGGSPVTLSTRTLKLRLRPGPPTTATMYTTRSGIYARFHRPRGARGPLLYEADDTCAAKDVRVNHVALWWSKTAQTKLAPSCPNPTRWVVVAGWPNYPVAQIDYTGPPLGLVGKTATAAVGSAVNVQVLSGEPTAPSGGPMK
jgi:hypothetical protein